MNVHNTFAPLRWHPRPQHYAPRSAWGPSPPRYFCLLIRQFLESGAPESRTLKRCTPGLQQVALFNLCAVQGRAQALWQRMDSVSGCPGLTEARNSRT